MIEHFHILHDALKERLNNNIDNAQLIKYSKGINIELNLNTQMFNKIAEMYVSGEIVLTNSKWVDEPNEFEYDIYNLSKKPKFLNKDNYKKIQKLSSNKEDWKTNWWEYKKKYPIYGLGYCNYKCYDNESNAFITNRSVAENFKCKDYCFIVRIKRQNMGFQVEDKGQYYAFKFKDNEIGFVKFFKTQIINQLAHDLISTRYDEYINDECDKCISLINEIVK